MIGAGQRVYHHGDHEKQGLAYHKISLSLLLLELQSILSCCPDVSSIYPEIYSCINVFHAFNKHNSILYSILMGFITFRISNAMKMPPK